MKRKNSRHSDIMTSAIRQARDKETCLVKSWCPECGPGVPSDEDGLCAACGATATGPGADAALNALASAEASEASIRELEAMVADRGRERDAAQEAAGSAERKLRELDATCAAMREALEKIQARKCRCQYGCQAADTSSIDAKAALSGDAGRALLERVEAQDRRIAALESVAKAAREFRDAVAPMDYDAAAKALDYHLDALSYLDALEPKR